MAFWEIEHKGERKTAEEWGVTLASRRLQNLSPDVLTLEVVDVPDIANPPSVVQRDGTPVTLRDGSAVVPPDIPDFAYGDTLTVYRNNVRWFQGVVIKLPWHGTEDSETQIYEIAGPWWHLENIVFQQNWKEIDLEASVEGQPVVLKSRRRSRVLLGMADDGTLITTGAQLDAILAYAIGAGAPFAIGSTLAGQRAWTVEARDQTCAEVVRSILRWHPDAIASFDYSRSTPVLNIQPPGATFSWNVNDRRVVASKYAHRADLLPTAVALYYEQDHDFDGSTYTTTRRDVYPEGATGSEPGAIVATIPLRGASRTTQQQRIRVQTIPTASTSKGGINPELETWWADHVPWLARLNRSDWIVGGHAIELAERGTPPPPINGDEVVSGSTEPGDYPRELLNGNIEDWMNVRAARMVVSAVIAYDGGSNPSDSVKEAFPEQVEINGKYYPATSVSVEITGTNAITKLYRKVIKSEQAEAVPDGLARAYYLSLFPLRYEGTLTLVDDEVGEIIDSLGNKVALEDDGESLMAGTPIQTIDQDLQTGRTQLTLGPAEHLSPQDFLEALRIARALPKHSFSFAERTEAEPAAEGKSDSIGGYQAPRSNTVPKPSAPIRAQGFGYTILPDSKIKIEPGNLTEDGDTIHVCDPGPEKTIAGTEQLWVIADTAESGRITGVTTEWRTSRPTGLQKHREAKTNSVDDQGTEGKYAWLIVNVTNTSGKLTLIYSRHGIEYYSDRSAKYNEQSVTTEYPGGAEISPGPDNNFINFDFGANGINFDPNGGGGGPNIKVPKDPADPVGPANPGAPPNKVYHARCADSDGGRTWPEIKSLPPEVVRPDLPPFPSDFVGPVPEGSRHTLKETVPPWTADAGPPAGAGVPGIWHYDETADQWYERTESGWETRPSAPPGVPTWEIAPPAFLNGDGPPSVTDDRAAPGDWYHDNGAHRWYQKKAPRLTNGNLEEESWCFMPDGPPQLAPYLVDEPNSIRINFGKDSPPAPSNPNTTVDDRVPKDAKAPAPPASPSDPPNVRYAARCINSAGEANWPDLADIPVSEYPDGLRNKVDSVNDQSGSVVLDAGDIAETTLKKWLTPAERIAIATNTTDRHGHTNKPLLDTLINTGDGSQFLRNNGLYGVPDFPVDSVNGATGVVKLDTGDIAETRDKNYITDAEKTDIDKIPTWWPTTAPAAGTYSSFTVRGGSVIFNRAGGRT